MKNKSKDRLEIENLELRLEMAYLKTFFEVNDRYDVGCSPGDSKYLLKRILKVMERIDYAEPITT